LLNWLRYWQVGRREQSPNSQACEYCTFTISGTSHLVWISW
jgi:hypothetical protein